MRLGAMLGKEAVEHLEKRIERAELKERDKRRQRDLNKKRRLGKTIKYSREDR